MPHDWKLDGILNSSRIGIQLFDDQWEGAREVRSHHSGNSVRAVLRDTSNMRGSQDKYHLLVIDPQGFVTHDFGTATYLLDNI